MKKQTHKPKTISKKDMEKIEQAYQKYLFNLEQQQQAEERRQKRERLIQFEKDKFLYGN